MPSDSQLDFTHRVSPSLLPEQMDGPCSYAEFRDCLRSLEQCNRWLLGYRPTLHWLDRAARNTSGPLRILDVGSGHGDLLRRIERWARQRGIDVILTGIDLNPYAARAAQEAAPHSDIRWLTGDALEYRPDAPVDIIVSSLTMHHLEEDAIVAMLRWVESTARVGWFLNDLERSARSYRLFGILARIARWHPFVQHDGPVSIRRAFRENDWLRLLSLAGIPHAAVTLEHWRPGRLCVGRLR